MRIATLALTLLAAGLTACAPRAVDFAGETMGTTYHATVTRMPASVGREVVQAEIDAVLADVDRHLSTWDAGSELSKFNAGPGVDWVTVSPTLLEAVEQAQAVSRLTDGAFDATVSPLVRAWGFGSGARRDAGPPGAAEIARLQEFVGHQKLELRRAPPALRKTVPGLHVDLDGIAPGLAVDRIAARFEALGIGDYLVELGGEVRARGRNPAGRTWRVAVEAPLPGERRPLEVVELDGLGVSTSGDYRDFRDLAGRRISHTLDPRTGAPVTHRLTSATVIHPSAAMADGLATAIMVLGPEDGLSLARRLGLAVLLIERAEDGSFVRSETESFARLRRPLE
jgi:thiamine biosynthesis lipoprotein